MCDQAAIVPRFTLSLPVDAYTQWKKVGSLLSSCWHLRKTMPIHSLGIEALSGLDQSLFVSFGRGIPSLCIPLQWKKGVLLQGCRPHCEFRRLAANKKQTCILNDRSSFTETHIRNTKKKKRERKHQNMSVLLLQLLFDFASVNLDKTQVHNVSACVGRVYVSLQETKTPKTKQEHTKQKKEAVCSTASRLEVMGTAATTTANSKNINLAKHADLKAYNASEHGWCLLFSTLINVSVYRKQDEYSTTISGCGGRGGK